MNQMVIVGVSPVWDISSGSTVSFIDILASNWLSSSSWPQLIALSCLWGIYIVVSNVARRNTGNWTTFCVGVGARLETLGDTGGFDATKSNVCVSSH